MPSTINSTSAESSASPEVDPKSQAVKLFFSDMISQMEEDFQKSGDSIMDRMREISSKMDGLEQSISDLMHDAGLEEESPSEELNTTNGNSMNPSPARRPPSNSSPSRKSDGVQL